MVMNFGELVDWSTGSLPFILLACLYRHLSRVTASPPLITSLPRRAVSVSVSVATAGSPSDCQIVWPATVLTAWQSAVLSCCRPRELTSDGFAWFSRHNSPRGGLGTILRWLWKAVDRQKIGGAHGSDQFPRTQAAL